MEDAEKRQAQRDGLSVDKEGEHKAAALPTPPYCSARFCDKTPRCITSYEPNLAWTLCEQLVIPKDATTIVPRLGICHYLNDPAKALKDVEARYGELGYIDRKFAYQLAIGKKDVSFADISFTSETGGPLIICELPW